MNQWAQINAARLPQTYEAARAALEQCSAVDECKDWADKAAALASYAKQAEDDQLETMAQRIRARAIRRAGEPLKQIEPGQGTRDGKREAGDHLPLRSDIARDAGMSPHQAKQAVRVASVSPRLRAPGRERQAPDSDAACQPGHPAARQPWGLKRPNRA